MTTPSHAKYRDNLTGAAWSGRGPQPKWLKVALANGARLNDFEVAAAAAAEPDSASSDGQDEAPTLGAEAHARVFMLGRMIEAAKSRFTTLPERWSALPQHEQACVLSRLAIDMREVVKDAVKIIAANARVTFRAEVESVQFKGPTDVKAVLKLINGPETHALADVAGGFVTVVIESIDELLQIPDGATAGAPDNLTLFDQSAAHD